MRARYLLSLILLSSHSVNAQPHVPPGFQYVMPLAGARWVSPRTSVAIRPGALIATGEDLSGFLRTEGSLSGSHTGSASLSDDGRTLVFEPSFPFLGEEVVTVTLQPGLRFVSGDLVPSLTYTFATDGLPGTQPPPAAPAPSVKQPADAQSSIMNGVGMPSDFPFVTVPVNGATASGGLFFSNWGGAPYMFILRNDGSPLFYRRMPSRARDFKIQPTGTLTYRLAEPYNVFYGMDSTFTVTDTFACGNGYGTDEHECQMLPDGHVLLIALDYRQVDMSAIVSGGNPNATVIGNHLQELDRAKHVVFEWRSWDHYDIADAVHENLTAASIDYVHMNAISVDDDGNYVVSSRHLSEITKIDRLTGAVIWRLGGAHNQFTFTNDPQQFSYQHDVRALGGGHFTVFDNGNFKKPPFTRGVEFAVDTTAKTATVVWQYRHSPDWYTGWMGNVQRLPNGNTLICWADQSLPTITEVTSSGTIVYQSSFVSPAHCYRAFRFDWMGKAAVPYILVESTTDSLTLIANTWGRTDVASYRVYAGLTPSPTAVVDSGRGPLIRLTQLEGGKLYYFRVTAVDSAGKESGYSNEESALVRVARPGDNLVQNPGFDDGMNFWSLGLSDNATASSSVAGGQYVIHITAPGPNSYSVQLKQGDLPLTKDRKYLFEFDGVAAAPRTIAAQVEQDGGSYTNYSKSGTVALTSVMKHFSVAFTMTDPTDLHARITFNCGVSATTVVIDNVSLKEVIPTAGMTVAQRGPPSAFRLTGVYPHPFNPSTTLRFDLPAEADVRAVVYDLLGRTVLMRELGRCAAGPNERVLSLQEHASGIYLVRLTSTDRASGGTAAVTTKLLLLK